MSDHNPLACISWINDRKYCDPANKPDTAICEHDGCTWESTAATDQAQIEAFIAHHTNRHQEGQ